MERIMLIEDPDSTVAEAYRNLQNQILFANLDNKIKKVMITSTYKGEGKSTIISNVAFAMIESGYKVILIDCDLRRPSIHKKFHISNLEGITDILLRKDDFHKYIHRIHNVDILTSGKLPKNPSQILSSKSMSNLLEQIGVEYDYILIDMPPVVVFDPMVLINLVDSILYVIKSGVVELDDVQKNIKKLQMAGANIMGVILNGLDVKKYRNDYYKYYESKYK